MGSEAVVNQSTQPEPRIIQARTERACAYCARPIPAGSDACRVQGGLAHVACKQRHWSLLTSAALAEKLGLTSRQFLKLANQVCASAVFITNSRSSMHFQMQMSDHP